MIHHTIFLQILTHKNICFSIAWEYLQQENQQSTMAAVANILNNSAVLPQPQD